MSRLVTLSPVADERATEATAKSSTPDLCGEPSLGRLLRRANRLVQSTIEARFGAADLNFTQWNVLDCIHRTGPMSVSDLVAAMQIAKTALSRITDGLEARHLLTRERDIADRRLVTLRLTPAGRAKVVEIWPIMARRCDEILAGLTDEEVGHLGFLLCKLASSIERNASAPCRKSQDA